MFWTIVDELYELSKKVIERTDAYINFEMSTNENLPLTLFVKDKGFKENTKYDGTYYFYNYSKKEDVKEFKKAKAHLNRLLSDDFTKESEVNGIKNQ